MPLLKRLDRLRKNGRREMRVLYLITNNSLADGIARHILNITSYFAGHPEYHVEPAVCIAMPQGDLYEALKQNDVKVY